MPQWLQWFTAIAGVLGFGTALATWVRTRPAMRKIELEGEAALWAEIRALKDEAARERSHCDERIARLEDRHASALLELRTELSLDVQILRHDRNNIKTAMTYLLVSIRKIDHPELRAIAAEAEAMLARGDELIALEKGARKP